MNRKEFVVIVGGWSIAQHEKERTSFVIVSATVSRLCVKLKEEAVFMVNRWVRLVGAKLTS
ncbi:MAG TPA: hypothetical protein PKX91_02000 [Clostridia bacterium]|jgi:hypothetical protein|nr:hypothetical protein [Clostridia bacterium]